MATANPFTAFDFTKLMADFKVPAFDVEKLMATQRKNLEAVASANKLFAESAQTVFQRNAAIMRENVEEMTAAIQELSVAGEPTGKAARQADLAKEAFERTVASFKELNDSVSKTNGKVFDVLNKRFTESLDEAKGLVANGAK